MTKATIGKLRDAYNAGDLQHLEAVVDSNPDLLPELLKAAMGYTQQVVRAGANHADDEFCLGLWQLLRRMWEAHSPEVDGMAYSQLVLGANTEERQTLFEGMNRSLADDPLPDEMTEALRAVTKKSHPYVSFYRKDTTNDH